MRGVFLEIKNKLKEKNPYINVRFSDYLWRRNFVVKNNKYNISKSWVIEEEKKNIFNELGI